MGPNLAVVLPINRGLPYLTESVRDILKQDLQGKSLELICSWDGGRQDDWTWLVEVASLAGSAPELYEVGTLAWTPHANPAAEPNTHQAVSLKGYPSARDVADAKRPEHVVRVIRYADGKNRGQGAAMSLALAVSTAPIVAQMEADDTRPRDDALRVMLDELTSHSDWDGACTTSFCFGSPTDGMRRYVAWQNTLMKPMDLARARFIEIPALHQTALFRREAIDRVLAATNGVYRDGPFPSDDEHDAALDTPVDLWWWLAFFHLGLRCGRVRGEDMFGWRQHDAQRTRSQGRLSIANLRRIKVHWLIKSFAPSSIIVVSVGDTLRGWRDDIAAHPKAPSDIKSVEWRPFKRDHDRTSLDAARYRDNTLRLWAYGNARLRERIRPHIDDWDPDWDMFVA